MLKVCIEKGKKLTYSATLKTHISFFGIICMLIFIKKIKTTKNHKAKTIFLPFFVGVKAKIPSLLFGGERNVTEVISTFGYLAL